MFDHYFIINQTQIKYLNLNWNERKRNFEWINWLWIGTEKFLKFLCWNFFIVLLFKRNVDIWSIGLIKNKLLIIQKNCYLKVSVKLWYQLSNSKHSRNTKLNKARGCDYQLLPINFVFWRPRIFWKILMAKKIRKNSISYYSSNINEILLKINRNNYKMYQAFDLFNRKMK